MYLPSYVEEVLGVYDLYSILHVGMSIHQLLDRNLSSQMPKGIEYFVITRGTLPLLQCCVHAIFRSNPNDEVCSGRRKPGCMMYHFYVDQRSAFKRWQFDTSEEVVLSTLWESES